MRTRQETFENPFEHPLEYPFEHSFEHSFEHTFEHTFGTLKSWMGYSHFQMKTLEHVNTELSLQAIVQADNTALVKTPHSRIVPVMREPGFASC